LQGVPFVIETTDAAQAADIARLKLLRDSPASASP
jgi:hypothetical protein